MRCSNNVMFPGQRPTLMLADGGDPVPAGPASLQLEQRLSGSPRQKGGREEADVEDDGGRGCEKEPSSTYPCRYMP
jgi:hypothetical protein